MKSEELYNLAKEHFNQPVLSFGVLARVIGYHEDDHDAYFICKTQKGEITYQTISGGYIFLQYLEHQNIVESKYTDEIWSDLTRLQYYLPPIEAEFLVQVSDK